VNENSKHLLIIDDDDLIAIGLRDYLELHEFHVDSAPDYETAKNLVSDCKYAIAIVDVVLSGHPAEFGMAFLRWLRERSPTTIPVVLTGYRTAWLEHFASGLGITLILDKPKSFDEIAGLLTTALSNGEQVRGETRI
jgi:DNA-binding response OmpR family regulator